MKPPPLDYLKAATIEEATAALGADEDAKVLAGGQSLMPLLALRLARPTTLVDITGLGLVDVVVTSSKPLAPAGEVRIGALVRQRRIEFDPALAGAVPLLADAVRQVGFPATRNRGTFGGSLAHSDPVAELPAVAVALDGRVVATGVDGTRQIPCAELSQGFFTTSLAPDEIITEVVLAGSVGPQGAAWCEWAPRAHDFAEAGAGVTLDFDAAGACTRARGAACGNGGPRSLTDALAVLAGESDPTPALLAAVAAAVTRTGRDAGASVDEAELTGLLAARATYRAYRSSRPAAHDHDPAVAS